MINILAMPLDNHGCGYYRITQPYTALQKNYPEKYEVRISFSPTDEDFKWCDIFVTHKHDIFNKNKILYYIKRADFFNKVVIYDLDDADWVYPHDLPMGELIHGKYYRDLDAVSSMLETIKYATFITCSTKNIATEIGKITKTSVIYPISNKIDLSLEQWNHPVDIHTGINIGWCGGSSHIKDLSLIRGIFQLIDDKLKHKLNIYLCGYDTRGLNYIRDVNGKLITAVTEGTAFWDEMVQTYSLGFDLNRTKVIPTKDIEHYGENYSLFDITVAPVRDGRFESCKSELKAIEAGAYGLGFVASNIGAYSEIIKHEENGFLVNNKKGRKDWEYYLKILANEDKMRIEMGNNLRKTVEERYEVNNTISERDEIINDVLGI